MKRLILCSTLLLLALPACKWRKKRVVTVQQPVPVCVYNEGETTKHVTKRVSGAIQPNQRYTNEELGLDEESQYIK